MPDLREQIGDDHYRRMKAAEARAQWELGDPSWAGVIIGAYLYPEADSDNLEHEKGGE